MTHERSSNPTGIQLPFRLKERLLETLADIADIGIVLAAGDENLVYLNNVARALWCPDGIDSTISCAADLWRQVLSRATDPERLLDHIQKIRMRPESAAEFRFSLANDRYVAVQTVPCDTGEGGRGRLWTFRHSERRVTGPSATIVQLAELLASIIQAGILVDDGLDLSLSAERYRSEVERCAQQALALVQQMSPDRRRETRESDQ
jgi:hypothetical protein